MDYISNFVLHDQTETTTSALKNQGQTRWRYAVSIHPEGNRSCHAPAGRGLDRVDMDYGGFGIVLQGKKGCLMILHLPIVLKIGHVVHSH